MPVRRLRWAHEPTERPPYARIGAARIAAGWPLPAGSGLSYARTMDGLEIVVVGAGIGGLAAAALLADRGHKVRLVERFAAPRPVGSGLVLQPVGLAVLDTLGIGLEVRAAGAPLRRLLGHEAERGRPVLDVSYGAASGLGIHRARLFAALLDAVRARNVPIRTGAPATHVAGGTVFLRDTAPERADLVVDAAGAGSALSPLKGRPLPYGAIWGTVDWPTDSALPADRLSQRYRRADRMVGVLPVGCLPGDPVRKAALFWSLPADGEADWRATGLATWRREAVALWPDVAPFVDQIDRPERMTMARYSHGSLRRPWNGSFVHIGDAAHRASPQLGQGANMALLDALALARALERHPGRAALDQALTAYSVSRRWHVRAYQAMSAAFTPQYQSDSRWLPVLRDRVLFPLSRIPPVPRVLTALVAGTLVAPLPGLGWPDDQPRPSDP